MGEFKIQANASKRVQRLLADFAKREHFRANKVWSIQNSKLRAGRVCRECREVKEVKEVKDVKELQAPYP